MVQFYTMYVLYLYTCILVVFGGFYNIGRAPDPRWGSLQRSPIPPSWAGGVPPSRTLPGAALPTRLPFSTTGPLFVQWRRPCLWSFSFSPLTTYLPLSPSLSLPLLPSPSISSPLLPSPSLSSPLPPSLPPPSSLPLPLPPSLLPLPPYRFEALAELIWRSRLLAKQFDLMKTRLPQGILQNDVMTGVIQLITKQLVDLIQAYVDGLGTRYWYYHFCASWIFLTPEVHGYVY